MLKKKKKKTELSNVLRKAFENQCADLSIRSYELQMGDGLARSGVYREKMEIQNKFVPR